MIIEPETSAQKPERVHAQNCEKVILVPSDPESTFIASIGPCIVITFKGTGTLNDDIPFTWGIFSHDTREKLQETIERAQKSFEQIQQEAQSTTMNAINIHYLGQESEDKALTAKAQFERKYPQCDVKVTEHFNNSNTIVFTISPPEI